MELQGKLIMNLRTKQIDEYPRKGEKQTRKECQRASLLQKPNTARPQDRWPQGLRIIAKFLRFSDFKGFYKELFLLLCP